MQLEDTALHARAVEPLIAALKGSDRVMQWRAAEALGTLGAARAVEPLIAALKDSKSSVRMSAAEALGKLGDARAVGWLINALKGDRDVRWRAAKALRRIGTPGALAAVREYEAQEKKEVKSNAPRHH